METVYFIIPLVDHDNNRLAFATALHKAVISRAIELGYNNNGKIAHTDPAIVLCAVNAELHTTDSPHSDAYELEGFELVDLNDFFFTDRYEYSSDIIIAGRTVVLNKDGINVGCTTVPWVTVDAINAKRKASGFIG